MKNNTVEMTITDSSVKKIVGKINSETITKLNELHGLDGKSEMYEVLMEKLNEN